MSNSAATKVDVFILGRFALANLLLAAVAFTSAHADEESRVEVIKKVRPATVFVVVPGQGSGTGFVVDREERLVVTCAHVIGKRTHARVHFPLVKNGKPVAEREAYTEAQSIPATVVDLDPSKDLCVLRLDRLPADAPAVSLADDSPEPGEEIFSIGNPASSDALWIYTSGSVRQVYHKKSVLNTGEQIDALTVETQAPINSGDSGGPVFNSHGKLIGVNSFINSKASLFSGCIDVTEVAAALKTARRWLQATTAAEFQDRGQHYLKLKLYERAVTDFNRLIDLKPEAESFLLRADAFIQAAPTESNQLFAYTLAITDCVQGLRLNPDSPRAFALRGRAYLELNQAAQAVFDYSAAILLEPEVADHFVQRGLAHARASETEAALSDFDAAHNLDPKAARPQLLRGEVLLAARQFEKAIEAFDLAAENNPKIALLHDLRGDANVGLKRYKDAVNDYTKALDLQPNTIVYLTDRAHALNELRQNHAAADDCNKVLAAQPKNIRALYERARASHGLGQTDAALEDANKVLGQPVNLAAERRVHADSHLLKGRIHLLTKKDYEQAIADLTRTLAMDPNNTDALNLRGIAHGHRGDHDLSLKDHTAALSLAPKNAVFLFNRAYVLMKQDKYDDAVKEFTAAIEANPKYAAAFEQRAKAYEKLEEMEKAATDVATAAELRKGEKK